VRCVPAWRECSDLASDTLPLSDVRTPGWVGSRRLGRAPALVRQACCDQHDNRRDGERIADPELDWVTTLGAGEGQAEQSCGCCEHSRVCCSPSGRHPPSEAQLLTTGEDDLDGGLVEPVDCSFQLITRGVSVAGS